jgi:biopolymer transport protein ExbD
MKVLLLLLCISITTPTLSLAEFYIVTVPKKTNTTEAVIYLLQEKLCQIKYGESCHGDNEAQYQKIIELLNQLGGDTNISPENPQPE